MLLCRLYSDTQAKNGERQRWLFKLASAPSVGDHILLAAGHGFLVKHVIHYPAELFADIGYDIGVVGEVVDSLSRSSFDAFSELQQHWAD